MTPGDLVPWISLAVSVAGWWNDNRRRRLAEAEIARRNRTALHPYLVLTERYRSMVMLPELGYVHPGNAPYVLQPGRDSVGDIGSGDTVILMVDNLNLPALETAAELDGQHIQFGREPDLNDASGGQWFEYPFDPSRRGAKQRLRVTFLARNGSSETHTYQTEHGLRRLVRVDPPKVQAQPDRHA